jgi:peroxiredoxin/RNA polymerase subunit RPABC4/transcription elongation factor Spt4
MTEGQSQTGPRFCRQCGGVVPEGTALCPKCGQKWYMDRTEQQGVDLWQKIIEKRAASGVGGGPSAEDQGKYRCPNCMAILKGPAAVCPHCGQSTIKAKIAAADRDTENPAGQNGEDKLNLPDAAKGLASIKGATRRAAKFKGRKRIRTLDAIIIAVIVVVVAGIAFMLARQYGFLPSSLSFFSPAKPSTQQQATTPATQAGPTISGVMASDLTSDSAAIAWSTNTPAWGKVLYGKSDSYGESALATLQMASQKVVLKALEPTTTYHFAVLVTDGKGQELSRSEDKIFSTLAPTDTKPPMLSQLKVIPTDIGAIIQWVTDEPSTSQVIYGSDQTVTNTTQVDSRLVKEHSVHLNGLEANNQYYYRVRSADAAGNETVMNPVGVFTTLITVPLGSRVGERAADFTLPIFQSQDSVVLRSYKGQKILLTFWAVYCPDCDRELALLQALKNKNIPNVKIIAVIVESKPEDIEKTIARYKAANGDLTFPVAVDAYKTTAHLYNVEKVPCTFFIDSDMIIRNIEFGGFNADQVEQILNDL